MPDLGRWNGMDQLAESYHSASPYTYVFNNPVSLVDVDGRWFDEGGNIIDGSGQTAHLTPKSFRPMYTLTDAGFQRNLTFGDTSAFTDLISILDKKNNEKYMSLRWWTDYSNIKLGILHDLKRSTGLIDITNWYTGSFSEQFSGGWDSNFVRSFTGDFVNVGVGFSGVAGIGAGTSWELNWVLHGPQSSILPAITTTVSAGVGYNLDLTLNVGNVNYTGNASDITRGMLITNSSKAVGDFPTMWAAGSLTAIGEVGVTGAITPSGNEYLIGGQLNVGLGLPLGPVPINGSIGASNTYLIKDFK